MSFYVESSSSPANLYIFDIGEGSFRKLTNTLNPEIDEKDLVTAEVVRFTSFDGTEIPGIFINLKGQVLKMWFLLSFRSMVVRAGSQDRIILH